MGGCVRVVMHEISETCLERRHDGVHPTVPMLWKVLGYIILELPTVRLWSYNNNTVINQVDSKEVTQLHTVSILRHVRRRPFSTNTITFLCIQGRASGTPSETVYRGMGESNLRYVLRIMFTC